MCSKISVVELDYDDDEYTFGQFSQYIEPGEDQRKDMSGRGSRISDFGFRLSVIGPCLVHIHLYTLADSTHPIRIEDRLLALLSRSQIPLALSCTYIPWSFCFYITPNGRDCTSLFSSIKSSSNTHTHTSPTSQRR